MMASESAQLAGPEIGDARQDVGRPGPIGRLSRAAPVGLFDVRTALEFKRQLSEVGD